MTDVSRECRGCGFWVRVQGYRKSRHPVTGEPVEGYHVPVHLLTTRTTCGGYSWWTRGRELRNAAGTITATYAPLPH